jgi:hypothetical protein
MITPAASPRTSSTSVQSNPDKVTAAPEHHHRGRRGAAILFNIFGITAATTSRGIVQSLGFAARGAAGHSTHRHAGPGRSS